MLLSHALFLSLLQAPAPAPAPAADEVRGLRLNGPGALPGYTLIAPLSSHHTYLLDLEGQPVHRWTSEYGPSSVYLLDDGSILRTARIEDNKTFEGGGICGRVERIAWDGKLVWSYELATEDQTSHHDALPMPNGNVLLIAWEFRFREDQLAVGRDPAHVLDKGLWPDSVLEVKPTLPAGGEIVWEWHAWDHLIQDVDPKADHYGSIPDHPELLDINYDHRDAPALTPEERRKQEELAEQMSAVGYAGGGDEEDDAGAGAKPLIKPPDGSGPDWMHTNAVSYDPGLDLIALSSPHLSEIFVIDHSTTTDQAASHKGGKYGKGGDLLWRWGNPQNHGAGTKADRKLFYQHNVQWIAAGLPGAGHLLVFNNGQGRPDGEHSEVLELALPFEAGKGFTKSGRAFGPEKPAWSYAAPDKASFYSAFISGCQRLPNGNTLACEGPKGRILEVTSAGEVVWEYWNALGGDLKEKGGGGTDAHALFRATRIAQGHPALKGRTLAPLDPATLK